MKNVLTPEQVRGLHQRGVHFKEMVIREVFDAIAERGMPNPFLELQEVLMRAMESLGPDATADEILLGGRSKR